MKFTESELIDLENAYLQVKGSCTECDWERVRVQCRHTYEHIRLTFDRKRLLDRLIAFARASAVEPIPNMPALSKVRNGRKSTRQQKDGLGHAATVVSRTPGAR